MPPLSGGSVRTAQRGLNSGVAAENRAIQENVARKACATAACPNIVDSVCNCTDALSGRARYATLRQPSDLIHPAALYCEKAVIWRLQLVLRPIGLYLLPSFSLPRVGRNKWFRIQEHGSDRDYLLH